jgi:hypothetical protein
MYNATKSPYQTSSQTGFRFSESENPGRFERASSPLQQQATGLLSSASSREMFQPRNSGADMKGLPQLELTEDKGGAVTSVKAATIGESKDAIKATNPDGDQVSQMLDLHPTAELFAELKQQDPQQAKDFAVANPDFHAQAMHDMDDESFQQEVRLRVTGLP